MLCYAEYPYTDQAAGKESRLSEPMLTVQQIAERLQVHEETVRRWLREGVMVGINFGGKSGYRVRQSELEAFLDRRAADPKLAA